MISMACLAGVWERCPQGTCFAGLAVQTGGTANYPDSCCPQPARWRETLRLLTGDVENKVEHVACARTCLFWHASRKTVQSKAE